MKVALTVALLGVAVANVAGCGSKSQGPLETTGTAQMKISLYAQQNAQDRAQFPAIGYVLTAPGYSQQGSFSSTEQGDIEGILRNVPAGPGYVLSLHATSRDGAWTCTGSSRPFREMCSDNDEDDEMRVQMTCVNKFVKSWHRAPVVAEINVECNQGDGGTPDASGSSSGGGSSGGSSSGGGSSSSSGGGPSPCAVYNGGAGCTPTEQLFVDESVGCYQCLVVAGCLDDALLGDRGHECGDLSGAQDAGAGAGKANADLCLATTSCILSTGCASTNVAACYCGSLGTGAACGASSAAGDGACAQQEVDGLGRLATDPASTVDPLLLVTNTPSGRANEFFACGAANGCTSVCSPRDGGGCIPKVTCPAGQMCGTMPDGCGGTILCGTCVAPLACGPSGKCVDCVPSTCASTGVACGPISDGCGGVVQCGTCDAGQCSNGQCGASPCAGFNAGAACTPTEQRFVNKSTDCYTCLASAGCLDDVILGDRGHECGDLTTVATAGARTGAAESDLCLATLDCILQTSCAASAVDACYCGSLGSGPACSGASAGANGVCLQPEVDGTNHLASDAPSAVAPDLLNVSLGAGKANGIFACASVAGCSPLCSQ